MSDSRRSLVIRYRTPVVALALVAFICGLPMRNRERGFDLGRMEFRRFLQRLI